MSNVITRIECTDACLSAGGNLHTIHRLYNNASRIGAQELDNFNQVSIGYANAGSADSSHFSSGYLQKNLNQKKSLLSDDRKRYPVFLSFSEADYDLATQLSDNLQNSFAQTQIEQNIQCIREKVRDLSLDTETFLRLNGSLLSFVKKSFDTLESQIHITGEPVFSFSLCKYIDIEIPEMEELQLTVRLKVDNHNILMGLWETFDKEIYGHASKEIKSKLNTNFEPL